MGGGGADNREITVNYFKIKFETITHVVILEESPENLVKGDDEESQGGEWESRE